MDDAIVLPVTLLATIACTMLGIWSDLRIGRARLALTSGRADAAQRLDTRRAAAAAFRSNALFFLMLLALLELARAGDTVLVVAALAFVGSRAVLIADSHTDRGIVRAAAVTTTLAAQLVLGVSGVAVAIG